MHLSVEGIRKILLLRLAHSWRLTASRAEEREEEEERKEKASLEGTISVHVNHNRVGSTVRGTMRKSQVHISPSLFDLNYVFYLCELGSHNRHAPLTYNADNRAPFVRT
jgi:hypothetical protein